MNLKRMGSSKVPEITAYFWIIKVLTTGMGEATSDFFAHRVGLTNAPALTVIGLVSGLILGVSLLVQLAARAYVAWIYWAAVAMVSVFGTMAADGLHFVLGVPYAASSITFF